MVLEWLIPKENVFFDMFDEQVEILDKIACRFEEIVKNYDAAKIKENEREMKLIEREADEVASHIFEKLATSFMVPIDHDDIVGIVKSIDSTIDEIEKVVSMFETYGIRETDETIIKFSELIKKEVDLIKQNVHNIRKASKEKKKIIEINNEIRKVEEEGDIIFRSALKNLFDEENVKEEGVLNVFKKNEIYSTLENALDRCKDFSNIISNILRKLA